jgi:hypothetical protein
MPPIWCFDKLLTLRKGNKDILHYLDDFPFGAEADSPKCQFTLQTFRDICKLWGVPVAEDKTVEPTEILTFLGHVLTREIK